MPTWKKKERTIINNTDVVIVNETEEAIPPEKIVTNTFNIETNLKPKKQNQKYKFNNNKKFEPHINCYNNLSRSKLVKEGCITEKSLLYVEQILNKMISYSEINKDRRKMLGLFGRNSHEALLYILNNKSCKYYVMFAPGEIITKHFKIDHLVSIYFDTKIRKYKVTLNNPSEEVFDWSL